MQKTREIIKQTTVHISVAKSGASFVVRGSCVHIVEHNRRNQQAELFSSKEAATTAILKGKRISD